jgi:hypothetical protein
MNSAHAVFSDGARSIIHSRMLQEHKGTVLMLMVMLRNSTVELNNSQSMGCAAIYLHHEIRSRVIVKNVATWSETIELDDHFISGFQCMATLPSCTD